MRELGFDATAKMADLGVMSQRPLFEGQKFWLSRNVPSRSRFRDMIQEHGGTLVEQEKDADIKLVDHLRKNLPADTYSYQYVERSVLKKNLEPLYAYRAGPSAPRPMGASNVPPRTHKAAFTLAEDQLLWDYLYPYEQKGGYATTGYALYQEFAAKYPRHTWQSWRERYRKKLRGQPRPGGSTRTLIAADKPSKDTDDNSPRKPALPRAAERDRTATPPESTQPPWDGRQRLKRKLDMDNEAQEASTHPSKPIIFSPQKRRAMDSNVLVVIPPNSTCIQREEAKRRRKKSSPSETQSRQDHNGTVENETPQDAQREPKESETKDPLDYLLMELPFFPASPEPEDKEGEEEGGGYEKNPTDIDSWIDTRLRTRKARSELQIIEALRCTSMDPELADKVLEHWLRAGQGIPDDLPGVWTREDDQQIDGTDARDIEQLFKKHGAQHFNARWEYLGLARSAGLEKEESSV
ncbi:hypothetical protein ASPZODRAFT_612194 [Penicilliopsis zonata CBS 506.65]|uniref:DNA-binding protein RAP1 n=1 Tax=Penicilliopsis zonata CBS 506.65 TaxID=1073090 RepID=A0A1L9SED6_9EURO|nr:hypothetical protein ASPZODRAFT_612194 [Penicilliopsis zonata CBS 506.65]OJJ45483.1 hypothetical protein ASPZODRAFT_612194 [Penicilliopsis zonata CBS 506.65]